MWHSMGEESQPRYVWVFSVGMLYMGRSLSPGMFVRSFMRACFQWGRSVYPGIFYLVFCVGRLSLRGRSLGLGMFCLIVCVFVFLNCNISQPTNSRPINSILRDIVQSINETASVFNIRVEPRNLFMIVPGFELFCLILFGLNLKIVPGFELGLPRVWLYIFGSDVYHVIVFCFPGEHIPSGDGDRLQVLVHHVQLWCDEMDHWHSKWRQQFRVGRGSGSGKQFRVGRDYTSSILGWAGLMLK